MLNGDWCKGCITVSEEFVEVSAYIATLPEFAEIRLPTNLKTFDFWDACTGQAVSVKTLNTNSASYLLNPNVAMIASI